eukprot:6916522-Pyramimonas_sp.AAC.1
MTVHLAQLGEHHPGSLGLSREKLQSACPHFAGAAGAFATCCRCPCRVSRLSGAGARAEMLATGAGPGLSLVR